MKKKDAGLVSTGGCLPLWGGLIVAWRWLTLLVLLHTFPMHAISALHIYTAVPTQPPPPLRCHLRAGRIGQGVRADRCVVPRMAVRQYACVAWLGYSSGVGPGSFIFSEMLGASAKGNCVTAQSSSPPQKLPTCGTRSRGLAGYYV